MVVRWRAKQSPSSRLAIGPLARKQNPSYFQNTLSGGEGEDFAFACHLNFLTRARKPQGAAAVQDASRPTRGGSNLRQVLESASPLALFVPPCGMVGWSSVSSEMVAHFHRECASASEHGFREREEGGGRNWIRTNEGVSQQIYSLPPLATWVSYRPARPLATGDGPQMKPNPAWLVNRSLL